MYFTGRALEQRRLAGAGDLTNGQVAYGGVRVVELWRVQDVECFGAKLDTPDIVRAESEALEYRHIELRGPGACQNVSSGITVNVIAR